MYTVQLYQDLLSNWYCLKLPFSNLLNVELAFELHQKTKIVSQGVWNCDNFLSRNLLFTAYISVFERG